MYDVIIDNDATTTLEDNYQEYIYQYFDTVKESEGMCPLQKNVESVEYTISHEPSLNLFSLEKVLHLCARGYFRNSYYKQSLMLTSVTVIKRTEETLKLRLQDKLNQFVLKSMDKDSLLQFTLKYIEKYPHHQEAASMLKTHRKTLYSDVAKKVYGYSSFKKATPESRANLNYPAVNMKYPPVNFKRGWSDALDTEYFQLPEVMVQGPELVSDHPSWPH